MGVEGSMCSGPPPSHACMLDGALVSWAGRRALTVTAAAETCRRCPAPRAPALRSSRRLDMWLPHGLAAGVTPATLKPLITICRFAAGRGASGACAPLPYDLTRPAKGQLRMAVSGLDPRQAFRVDVKASGAVKDAFGLPLQVGRGACVCQGETVHAVAFCAGAGLLPTCPAPA